MVPWPSGSPLLRSGPGGASRHSVPAACGGYSKLSAMPYIFSGFITSSWKRLPTNEIPNSFFTVPYFPLPPAATQRPRWGIAALRAGRPPLLRSGPGGASRHSVPAACGGYSKLSAMPYIFYGFITSSWKRLPTNEIPNPFLWFLSLLTPLLRSDPDGASRHSVPAAFGGYSKLSAMPYIFSGFITSSWKRLPTNEISNPFLWFLSLLPPASDEACCARLFLFNPP